MAGQLIARGDRTWVVRVFQGRDGKGKRVYMNRTVRGTKKEAQQILNAMLREEDMGTLMKPVQTSLNEHLDEWLRTVAKGRVRERTLGDYASIIDRYIRPSLGRYPLARLTAAEIQGLYTQLGERGLSAQTIRHIHAVINNALGQATKWRMIQQNPCSLVDLPRVKRKEMLALSPESARQFLGAAEDDRWYPLFALLIATGLRPGEALALRWTDIELETGLLSVQRTLAGTGGHWRFEEPKTANSRRQVPVPSSVVAALVEHKRDLEQDGVVDLGLVFCNEKGGPLEQRNLVQRHFKPILKRAGLHHSIRMYDLRHTCATLLLSAGMHPKIVSERLGHASVVLTLDRYSHVLAGMQQSAAEKLEEILYGS